MLTILLITFATMCTVIVIMAVGVIAGREPIKGSCGGLNRIGLDGSCEVCGGDLSKCDEQDKPDERKQQGAAFYDATAKQSPDRN